MATPYPPGPVPPVNTLSVGELIAKLQTLPPELPVYWFNGNARGYCVRVVRETVFAGMRSVELFE